MRYKGFSIPVGKLYETDLQRILWKNLMSYNMFSNPVGRLYETDSASSIFPFLFLLLFPVTALIAPGNNKVIAQITVTAIIVPRINKVPNKNQ